MIFGKYYKRQKDLLVSLFNFINFSGKMKNEKISTSTSTIFLPLIISFKLSVRINFTVILLVIVPM